MVVPGAKQTTSISYSQFKSKFGASSYSPPSMATPRAPAVAAAPPIVRYAAPPVGELRFRAAQLGEVKDLYAGLSAETQLEVVSFRPAASPSSRRAARQSPAPRTSTRGSCRDS